MLDERQSTHGLTVLTRLAQRKPESSHWLMRALQIDPERLASGAIAVAMQTGDPIGQLLAELFEAEPRPRGLESDLLAQIPEQTVALRELAVALTRRELEAARARGDAAATALFLGNLGNRLSEPRCGPNSPDRSTTSPFGWQM